MNTDFFNAFALGAFYHSFEVVYVRVNVAVGEKSYEVECSVIFAACDKLFPSLTFKHFARCDGFRNELCALRKYLSRAECVVTDFGVAHIVVGGKPYGCAVCGELSCRIFCHEHIEGGSICICNGVSLFAVTYTYAVHNDCKDGTFNAYGVCGFFEYVFHNGFLFS